MLLQKLQVSTTLLPFPPSRKRFFSSFHNRILMLINDLGFSIIPTFKLELWKRSAREAVRTGFLPGVCENQKVPANSSGLESCGLGWALPQFSRFKAKARKHVVSGAKPQPRKESRQWLRASILWESGLLKSPLQHPAWMCTFPGDSRLNFHTTNMGLTPPGMQTTPSDMTYTRHSTVSSKVFKKWSLSLERKLWRERLAGKRPQLDTGLPFLPSLSVLDIYKIILKYPHQRTQSTYIGSHLWFAHQSPLQAFSTFYGSRTQTEKPSESHSSANLCRVNGPTGPAAG